MCVCVSLKATKHKLHRSNTISLFQPLSDNFHSSLQFIGLVAAVYCNGKREKKKKTTKKNSTQNTCENGPVCADEKTWHDRGRKKETDKQEYKKKDLRHVEKQTHTTKKKLSKGSYYKKEKNNNNKKKCERKGNSSTSHFDLCHVYSPQNESKEQNYQGTIIE